MGMYEDLTSKGCTPFNPRKETARYEGFRDCAGERIEVFQTAEIVGQEGLGAFSVRALNPSGMRVTVSGRAGVKTVEPGQLRVLNG